MGNQQPTGRFRRSKSDYFTEINGHGPTEPLPRRISAGSSGNLLERFQRQFANAKRRGSSSETLCRVNGSNDNLKPVSRKIRPPSHLAAPRMSLAVSENPVPPPTAMPIKTILKKERSFNTSTSELNDHHQVYRSSHSVSFDNGSLHDSHESPYGSPNLLTVPTTVITTDSDEFPHPVPTGRKSSICAGLLAPLTPVHSHSWNSIADSVQPYEDQIGHGGIAENLHRVNLALANLTTQCGEGIMEGGLMS